MTYHDHVLHSSHRQIMRSTVKMGLVHLIIVLCMALLSMGDVRLAESSIEMTPTEMNDVSLTSPPSQLGLTTPAPKHELAKRQSSLVYVSGSTLR